MQISEAISSALRAISSAGKRRVAQQRRRRRLRVRAAAADRRDAFVGLDHVAGAREQEEMLRVADDHQRLQAAQRAVLAPILGQLDGGARKVFELGELPLELLEQRDAVGGRAGEAGQHLAAAIFAHLARAVLDDRLVEGHLAVAGDRQLPVAPHRENRGRANPHRLL